MRIETAMATLEMADKARILYSRMENEWPTWLPISDVTMH